MSFKSPYRDVLESIHESDEKEDYEKEEIVKPALFKHKEIVDVVQAEKEIEVARKEWEEVASTCPSGLVIKVPCKPINCSEVLAYFSTKNMSQFLKCIKPIKQRKGFDLFKHWLIGPPKLNNELIGDRNLFFALALYPFDTGDQIHIRVLQTLYKSLTGTEYDCPRYGKHWEEVGFQGIDPGTDLRGVGFLGLFHLLSLTVNPTTANLSKEICSLSKNENQNFPFCAMGINMTRIVIEAMREEILNRECNRRMDLFQVANDFYAGIYLHLYQIWYKENKTIMDSGYVLKDLNYFAKKHSSVIFKDLFNYIKEQKNHSQVQIINEFSDIGDITKIAKITNNKKSYLPV